MRHSLYAFQLSLLLAGTSAAAAPSLAEKEAARAAFANGDQAFEEGAYDTALRHYTVADELMDVPPTAFARCEALDKLGRLLEARDACVRASQLDVRPGEPASFADQRAKAVALAGELGERIPTITLRVAGADAWVATVDGEAVPPALQRIPLHVDPGRHTITITAEGYLSHRATLDLEERSARTVEVTLQPEAKPDAALPPEVPKAPVATSPPPVRAVEPDADGVSPLAWVGFSIGAAGLAAGGIAGGVAWARSSDLKTRCGSGGAGEGCLRSELAGDDAFEGDVSNTTTIAHVSTAGFVVGGIGVAVGLVGLFTLGGDGSDEPSVVVSPTSVSLRGCF